MAHAEANGRVDQRPALAGVVLVVAERVGDGFGHHDRPGEMDHSIDAVLADDLFEQPAITDVADDKLGTRRYGPLKSG